MLAVFIGTIEALKYTWSFGVFSSFSASKSKWTDRPNRFLLTKIYTPWLFNIAMENCPFIDGSPIKDGDIPWLCWITRGIQRVYICKILMRGESAIEIQWNTFVRYSGATTRSNTTVLSHTCSIWTYVLLHIYICIYIYIHIHTYTKSCIWHMYIYIHVYTICKTKGIYKFKDT